MGNPSSPRRIRPVIAAVDVGKLTNIGWWRLFDGQGVGGQDLYELRLLLAGDIIERRPLALGFECPLFMPLPEVTAGLGRQRVGDAGKPWCIGAGATSMAFGVQQAVWLLREIRRRLPTTVRGTQQWDLFVDGRADVVVWEAFVTGKSKDRNAVDGHVLDARAAVAELARRLDSDDLTSDIEDRDVLSLAGAALLRSEMTSDPSELSHPSLAVRAPVL